ncbi:MAG: MFS transporter [Bacteroidales bacterium]|jgi:MFS family permease|nr:MFS transporter [Bacteroidales bacterium]MCI2121758.1 MFS transporter [Bacteroidales bacterium]MCI2145899.1 MFS transporter [Bacteroidales bacterium]
MRKNKKIAAGSAMAFILLMGIVSMFSDMTHEGASSVLGAFLSLAGASAAAIGFTSGLGELVGYSLRLLTGIVADKTKKYWPMVIVGYIIDMAAIPALALIPKGGWMAACCLIIIERAGKAIKKPAKDTLVSFAASQEGQGKGFAIQEFLDQIGAFIGPLILYVTLSLKGVVDPFASYSICFAILGIPAVITVALVFFSKRKFPNPEKFEPETKNVQPFRLNRQFLLYIVAISLFAMGYVDFNLITMHTAKLGMIGEKSLPLLYALAMAIDAFSALFFGYLFDKIGVRTLAISTAIAAPFPFLIFGTTGKTALIVGVVLWGIGMGAQESIMKSAVGAVVPKAGRSTGFGIFQTAFGVFWFLGSWLMGILYDHNITAMIIFSVAAQLSAIPFYLLSARKH